MKKKAQSWKSGKDVGDNKVEETDQNMKKNHFQLEKPGSSAPTIISAVQKNEMKEGRRDREKAEKQEEIRKKRQQGREEFFPFPSKTQADAGILPPQPEWWPVWTHMMAPREW